MTDQIHEQITALGWAWHGSCGCSGGGNLYRKGLLNLRHYFKKQRWELRRKARLIANGHQSGMIAYLSAIANEAE